MQKRNFASKAAGLLAAGSLVTLASCMPTVTPPDQNTTSASRYHSREALNSESDAALSRLYNTVNGSKDLVNRSAGVLVCPSVTQGGFIIGGQSGNCELRTEKSKQGYLGATADAHYNLSSGSIGLQAGGQNKSLIYVFQTQEALKNFRENGWSGDANASGALIKMGANGKLSTSSASAPVQIFALTNTGLMGDLSLGATKITRLKY